MNHLNRDVQTACIWEATARKAGNVHRFADFDDLTYVDFLLSGMAIGPVLERMVHDPLGETVLEAVRATREVVSTNTNLGIVLLLVPLSKCRPSHWNEQLSAMLEASMIDDAKKVYEAIRLAVPGGKGKVENQDVAAEPSQTLLEVMALAADRDQIARQYATEFRDIFKEGVPALLEGWARFHSVEAAILNCQLHWLSRFPDSLIVRKRGTAEAEEVRRRARGIDLATREGRESFAELDAWLREEGHARNPGTTADLVTACLFVALRERRMVATMPFPWSS